MPVISTADLAALKATLEQALALTNAVRPDVQILSTPAQLNTALLAASAGDFLILDPTLIYSDPLVLTKPVALLSSTSLAGMPRIARDEPAPTFLNGLRAPSDFITLSGLAISHTNPLTDIVGLSGLSPVVNRCRILGGIAGAKRGVAANGGDMAITRCLIDECWQPAQDTQAIGAWDMKAPGLLIDDCYLGGGSQSVMLGGADPLTEAGTPSKVSVTNSTLSKNPAWYGKAQIKNAFEIKNGKDVILHNCVVEYSGTAQGMGGYLLVFTVRNQGGAAPFSTIERVTVSNCTGGKAAGICTILGSDNNHPSGTLDSLTITDCHFTELDRLAPGGGAGRLYTFDRAPRNVTLKNIVVEGQNLAAAGYFSGAPPVGLNLSGLTVPKTTYGWKIDGKGGGRAALLAYAPDALLDAGIV